MSQIIKEPDLSLRQNNNCSFIVRLWRGGQSETPVWRAAIEIPETGKRIGFAGLEQLFAFLVDFTECNCELSKVIEKKKEINSY